MKRSHALLLVTSLALPFFAQAVGAQTTTAAPAASGSASVAASATAPAPAATPAASSAAKDKPLPPIITPVAPPSGGAVSSEAKAMAETLFFTARGMMEAGRTAEACVKFEESYRLDAAAGTLLNLAVCHEKIGKVASAWGEFKQALYDAKKVGREDRMKLAQDHIDVLEPELPYLTIHVPAAVRVPGIEVVRNGLPLVQGGWDAELPVDPGVVEIITRAPQYKPRTQKIEIARKQHLEITVLALEKAPVSVMVVGEPSWSMTKKVGLGLMGLGVVGLGGGGYFGYKASQSKTKSDDNCPVFDGDRRCTAVGSDAMKDANRDAWISNIGIGVGLGSLAVGTYMFVTGGNTEPEAPKKASTRLDWHIAGGPNGFSGLLTGSF